MSLARGLRLFKNISNPSIVNCQVRHGHGPEKVFYRKSGHDEVPKWAKNAGDALIAFTTWWILWHCWHQPGHLFGEYDYPDPSKWTDAELGIPPDDE